MCDTTPPSTDTDALLTRCTTARIVYSDALDALLFESVVLVPLFSEDEEADEDDDEEEEEDDDDEEESLPLRA
ncbi:MAG: hypothetical protein OXE50_14015 [Chloroflexi bacterium]|nr:hypothetical protein [Chloroflexota bacterium]